MGGEVMQEMREIAAGTKRITQTQLRPGLAAI
jgi:hypothetical protein